uniref:tripartite motif-containing protein 59 isoform X2 n=1 Tax=Ciona intestinalis TaxID=7719 RepID=UPI000EF4B8B1|nr:tripartite motif-containing protein 59 isoform X2 [Ciona intestinalis]|eukprot:XP_026694126.1 tripartite motif-containing protein 59 isoform X2 [Ciona intestinalis]
MTMRSENMYTTIRTNDFLSSQGRSSTISKGYRSISKAITDTTRGRTSRATEFFDELPKELQCPKCGDLFDRPVLLSCSHTLCMDCAEDAIEYAELELKQRRRFSCPICRSAIKYNATGIESLPRNINIEEITPMQVVEKFQRIKRRLKNTKDALNEEIDVLGESIVKQQKIVYDLNEKAKELRLKVDQECDEMIAQIEKRRKSMYADVDKALNGKREKPDKKIETLRSQFTKMQVLTIQIQEVLEVKDAKDFIDTFNINGLPGKLQDMGKYIQS